MLTNAWLGLVEACVRVGRGDLGAQVDAALDRLGEDHSLDLARPVRQVIEDVQKRWRTERKTEGSPITPVWWVRHQVARALLTHILDARNAILARVSMRTSEAVQEAIERGQWRVAAMFGLASLQLDTSIRTHLPVIEAVAAQLETLRSQAIDDSRFPEPAQVAWQPDPELRPLLLRQLTDCMRELGAHPHDPAQPDLFGQIRTNVFDAAFQAILDGDQPLAGMMFGALFQQMEPTVQRLSTDLAGQTLDARIAYGFEPIFAMMELSGYALFMNELDGEGIWTTVRQLWDGQRAMGGPAAAKRLVDIADLAESIFALTPQVLRRENRRERLTRLLQDRGITLGASIVAPAETRPPHVRPIVAAFARAGIGSPWHLTDLFLVDYVTPQLEDKSVLPPRVKALAATLGEADAETAGEDAQPGGDAAGNIDQSPSAPNDNHDGDHA